MNCVEGMKTQHIIFSSVWMQMFFILNIKDSLGKFDSKGDNRLFHGYSKNSMMSKVYNSRTLVVEEDIHISFDKNKPDKDLSELDESLTDL